MADLPGEFAALLSDRYTLKRPLGRGGMATVYLADDRKHDRPVALKVLHPELGAALGAERFLREIRFAARLQHPLICTVLDSGVTEPGATSEGRSYYWFTMPYVEGESLRDRLNRETQLPLDDALTIAHEAAEALDYAHRHGVVHRDVKPENILLTEKHALVADFGIAKAIAGGARREGTTKPGDRSSSATETGVSVGTPAYMSPEQASGERELDARTDVYSLGCVLYEMLAGEAPHAGPTAQAVIAKRLATDPAPLEVVRAGIPPAVTAAVNKALARTPADRYASAADFAGAIETALRAVRRTGGTGEVRLPRQPVPVLRRAGVLFGLGLVVGLGVLFAWRRFGAPSPPAGSTQLIRLAVLPFENLGDSADAYFADGMTDEIRAKLASLPGLQVTASRSAAEYRNSAKSTQQIARELGVDYLLVGKVRWEKGGGGISQVRVSPELIQVGRVSAPTTRWEQPLDARLTEVFKVQADIAGRVAQALNLALGRAEQQELDARPTTNLAAYDAYLRGREAFAAGAANASLQRAVGFYERAVALDSSFALAWSELSRSHSSLYYNSVTPQDSIAASSAADRALALAPHSAAGHLAKGNYYNLVLSDWPAALEQFSLGRQLAPRDADLLVGSAFAQFSSGRWEEALASLEQAQALDPRSLVTAQRQARVLLWLRRYPEAEQAADRALALAPANASCIEGRAMVALAQGDLAGARAVLRAAPREMDPTVLVATVAEFWDLYWALNDDQQALLLRLRPGEFGDRFAWALALTQAYALRGDSVRARVFADSARIEGEARAATSPKDAQTLLLLGLSDAYLGRPAEAIRLGERGNAMVPASQDAYSAPYYQHLLARIYLHAGRPEKALDLLEQLLKGPYFLSSGWLRIDPEWKLLRGNPRFEKLITGT